MAHAAAVAAHTFLDVLWAAGLKGVALERLSAERFSVELERD